MASAAGEAVEEPAEVKSEGLEVAPETPQTPPPPEQQDDHDLPEPSDDANNDDAATLAELWPSRKPKSDSSTTSGRGRKIVKKATALKTGKKSGPNSTPKLTLSLRSGKSRSYEKYTSSANISGTPRVSLSGAMVRAEDIRAKLDPNFPTFVKSMVRSHVASCFFMGLPGPFCKAYLPQIDTVLIVEDENGKQYDVKYLGHKTGLSAGWRQFSVEHNLLEGDALVFQLLEASKLKVHIIRAAAIGAEVERTMGVLNLDSPAEIPETYVAPAGTVDPTPGKRKRRKSLPLSILQKKKKSRQQKASTPEIGRSAEAEQSGNHSEEVGSEVLESSRLNVLKVQFKDVATFEDFRILIDGVLVDPEFLEDTRRKYYDLCSSQKEFLHDNLMEGINLKLITGAISEIVSISDAIRACDLTTTQDKFASWVRTLSAFELLGMNVGFLRKRVERLIILAFGTERADEARKLAEAKSRRASAEEEIRKLELRLLELEEVTEELGTEIHSLGPKVESYEVQFQKEVSAPW